MKIIKLKFMKHPLQKLALLMVTMLLSITSSYGQNIKLMTYNIRLDNPNDGENAWPNRKENFVNQILFYEPDILGIQEGLEHQVLYLDDHLKTYKYVGIGRGDVKEKGAGEYSAIFYNFQNFKEIKSGTFWLSETPDKPSRGWDASLNRICTYILLKNTASGQKFWVFNTHFDHRGVKARKNSAALIIQKINSINKEKLPVFLMGDFNLQPQEEPIQFISKELNDSKAISQLPPYGPVGTSNGFDACKNVDKRIDYVFTSKDNITIKKYAVIADVNDVKYPSDHFPVFIEAELKK
jgi:endonuclease/exonuclease/phosphatase family metal-dependent hydrolase